MDIFDKFDLHAGVIDDLLDGDSQRLSPLGIQIDEVRSATDAMIDGKPVILAGTNNYLGLTFDPRCIKAACDATEAHGTGTTGSRVANGTYSGHRALEKEIADYLDRRAAIVFSTGYQANLAVLSGLGGPSDFIFIDADSHASIYDSCKLSSATVIRFKHNDPADLDKRLARLDPEHTNKLVVVEGIYSMIGDRAPLAEMVEVKRRHNAYMVLDEAHSLGVLGRNGRGLAEETEVEDDVDFVVGTFSKSLGAVGGFCASNHPKFEMLRVAARPYVYTASLPPSIIASVHAAVRLIRAEPELRTRLWRNVGALYNSLVDMGFTLCSEMSPIIAIAVPTPKEAMRLWSELLANGVYVNLMVPPATPANLSLLRCSVSAAHTEVQIEAICKAFETVAKSMGVAPRKAPAG
ncbi:MAG: aminotransferase class I/II-fold pyridoxal phosphate-dependent enzyme, partial [Alphaproteobacteria bacterium]